MCLTIDNSIKLEKADKDYTVYKVVSNNALAGTFKSAIQGYNYLIGGTYKATIKPTKYSTHVEYNSGLHYYTTLEKAKREGGGAVNYAILECIIPKDTIYTEDPKQELGVCNKLIISNKVPHYSAKELASIKNLLKDPVAAKKKLIAKQKADKAKREAKYKLGMAKAKAERIERVALNSAIRKAEKDARAKVIAQFKAKKAKKVTVKVKAVKKRK